MYSKVDDFKWIMTFFGRKRYGLRLQWLRQCFFGQNVASLWNKLPASVVKASSVSMCKKRLNDWIFDRWCGHSKLRFSSTTSQIISYKLQVNTECDSSMQQTLVIVNMQIHSPIGLSQVHAVVAERRTTLGLRKSQWTYVQYCQYSFDKSRRNLAYASRYSIITDGVCTLSIMWNYPEKCFHGRRHSCLLFSAIGSGI